MPPAQPSALARPPSCDAGSNLSHHEDAKNTKIFNRCFLCAFVVRKIAARIASLDSPRRL